jgi:peroxiredoxin
MATIVRQTPVELGEPAPDFTLPTADREGFVSLADYRGRSPLLLTLNRGLWCPFCRRHIARLGGTRANLRSVGVETLAVVATKPERARLYLRFRPAGVPLAADPDLITHRSYGLPKLALTPELLQAARAVRVNPAGDLPESVSVLEVNDITNRLDRFEFTDTDRDDMERQFAAGPQLTGQFLVDTDGIVRWANIECAEGLHRAGQYPTDEELLTAARALVG